MAAPEFGRAAGVLWLLPVLFWNGIVGGFDTVLALQYLRERRARTEWVEVDATVLSSEVVSSRSSDGTTYLPEVRFTYRFEGQDHESDRYSFGTFSTSDRSYARGVVRDHPEGAEVRALVDPEDPAEAVLDASGDAFPKGVVLFLTPFHCVGLWLIGRMLRAFTARPRRPGDRHFRRYAAVDDQDRLILRRPQASSWEVTLLAFGVLAFVSAFPVFFLAGIMGSGPLVVPVLAACALGAAAARRWSVRRQRDPARFLHVDRRLGRFSFPADEEGHPIADVEELVLRSRETNMASNGVPQVDHSLSARIGDGRVPVFRFRGAPEEGEALREALAAEFGLTS